MNAITPPSAFGWLVQSLPASQAEPTQDPLDISGRWDRLHAMAGEVGAMGQLAKEPEAHEHARFVDHVEHLSGNRQTLVHFGLADIEAVLGQGLDALRSLEESGQDVTAAAVTLWCEFYRSRQALLKLAASA